MPKDQGRKLIAQNKKARHDYHIEDTYEAGLVLMGTEVKSLRMGRASLADGFVDIEGHEAWLHGVHIPEYTQGTWTNHSARRKRKLLLNRHEIDKIERRVNEKGLTVIPLALYFLDGRAKVEIALAKGKKSWDKRHSLAERQANREKEQALGRRAQGHGVKDADVPAFWRSLGLPGLFDVHVHFLPENIQRRVYEQFDQAGPKIGREWPIRYRGPHDERVEHLRAMGVRRFPTLPYAHRPGVAAYLNDWARELRPRRARVAVVGDVLPRARGGDVRRGAARRRRRGVQDPRPGGGVRPRRPAARPGVGDCSRTPARRW